MIGFGPIGIMIDRLAKEDGLRGGRIGEIGGRKVRYWSVICESAKIQIVANPGHQNLRIRCCYPSCDPVNVCSCPRPCPCLVRGIFRSERAL